MITSSLKPKLVWVLRGLEILTDLATNATFTCSIGLLTLLVSFVLALSEVTLGLETGVSFLALGGLTIFYLSCLLLTFMLLLMQLLIDEMAIDVDAPYKHASCRTRVILLSPWKHNAHTESFIRKLLPLSVVWTIDLHRLSFTIGSGNARSRYLNSYTIVSFSTIKGHVTCVHLFRTGREGLPSCDSLNANQGISSSIDIRQYSLTLNS